MNVKEKKKKKAALDAVKLVKDGDVVGLGSGSTVSYVFQEIGRRIRQEKIHVLGIPTSFQTLMFAVDNGIPLTTLNEHSQLDITIDGADQIDQKMNLIKGKGGALTREKIVASASKQLIIVADDTKLVKKLGTNHPVPIEVLPFALPAVIHKIQKMGGKPVLRKAKSKVGPTITDNGNFIVDTHFGPIRAPRKLNLKVKAISGVVETGMFIEMADIIFIGKLSNVQKFERKS